MQAESRWRGIMLCLLIEEGEVCQELEIYPLLSRAGEHNTKVLLLQ